MKILFANIFQGMIFDSENVNKEHLFTGFCPSRYINFFKSFSPDVCCFAEMILDDDKGNSETVFKMSKEYDLPYYKSLLGEKSWIVEGKYYGLSILSRYPIKSYEILKLPNPKLEVIRPNGEHWIMHDKYVQKIVIEINGKEINIFNTHAFPFQHFNRKISDNEFSEFRAQMSKMLLPDEKPTIITGDFNNKGAKIQYALPELFNKTKISTVIEFEDFRRDYQYDHILITNDFKVSKAEAINNFSDHHAIVADIELL